MQTFYQQVQKIKVSEGGYTLIEVLVCIAIFAVLLMMIVAQSYASLITSDEIVESHIPDPSKVENAFAQAAQAEAIAMDDANTQAELEATRPESPKLLVTLDCDGFGQLIATKVEMKPTE